MKIDEEIKIIKLIPDQDLLSNNDIVIRVFKNYEIKKLIIRMINQSYNDQSYNDLEQYVYEQLLKFDNIRLNEIYHNSKLRNFISKIIQHQRDGTGHGVYLKYLHIKETNPILDIIDENEEDFQIELIINYINNKSEMLEENVYNSNQLKIILSFTILKKYYLSDLTQSLLAIHLNLSRTTVNHLIKFAREDILSWWEKNGKYID